MEKDILCECYEKAKEVIKACSTPNGLYASAGKKGYNAVWSRDSMISMSGASLINDKNFREVFKNSIITLGKNQGRTGQIPNCVDKWEERKPHVDFKTIDSTLWWLIGNRVYEKRYKDYTLLREFREEIKKAFFWLACQDTGEIGMPTQLPTSDWFDAFPHRYGYTINTQALYYKSLVLNEEFDKSNKLKQLVNENKEDGLWDKEFYYSYRWKNHGKYKEISDWFDSLGNFLAIVFDLATPEKANKILNYVKKKKIAEPYPAKTIFPSINKKSKYWEDYFSDCEAGTPDNYSNGGIWGYIGGFYILSLIKMKRFKEAEESLKKLAKRNLDGNFPEWTHAKTKKHYGNMQAWEAGMYILAYESLKNKEVLI
jgi:glycogen debranching enzyme